MPGLTPNKDGAGRAQDVPVGKGFWDYLERWRHIFPSRRALRWRDGWLQNGYCRRCRYCCGPQDSDAVFPMGLLPRQIRPGLEDVFFLLNKNTAYMDARGCKACTPQGCGLLRPERPVACGIFPFVLNAGRMYLYQTCPATLLTPPVRLAALGWQAAQWLTGFSREDLEHLALNLPEAVLAERYISLSLHVFGPWGVGLRQA